MSIATLTYAPPRFESVPEFTESMGDECIAFAEAAGLILDDWQCDIIRAALGVDPAGRWAAMEVALIVPRQNGKGSVLEALELYHLFMVPTTRLITHTAHRFDTCLDHFRRIRKLIEDTPELLALVKDNGRGIGDTPSGIKDSNGKESIELIDGCRLNFKARDKGSGAGFSGDLVVLDEAWYLRDLSGLIPTMAARENPQAWYTSSAPHPRVESDNLRSLIRQGRALAEDPEYTRPEPDDPTMAYFEWSVDPAVLTDLEDEDTIRAGNPAYGIRINRRFCRMERKRMGDELFARERHGIFHEADDAPQWLVLSQHIWNLRATKAENPDAPGWLPAPVTLSVEVSQGTAPVTTICAAGTRPDGIGAKLYAHHPETGWALDAIIRLALPADGSRPVAHVVIDEASPASSLIDPLEDAGIIVTKPKLVDIKKATGSLIRLFTEGGIEYVPAVELDAAVSVAKLRKAGESMVLDRWSDADASPFIGLNLAVWGHMNQPAAETTTTLW